METFAYLHAAQEYECPEKKEINLRWLNHAALTLMGMAYASLAVNLVSAAQATTVFRGDSGANVTRLQDLLRNAGYFPAATTGFFGDFTEAAVQDFQQSRGLAVDGVAGYETLGALEIFVSPVKSTAPVNASDSRTIASGNSFDSKIVSDNNIASGNSLVSARADSLTLLSITNNNSPAPDTDAKRLRRSLRKVGYLKGTSPSSIEEEEAVPDAVGLFQQANGLPVTGEADQATFEALESVPVGGAAQ